MNSLSALPGLVACLALALLLGCSAPQPVDLAPHPTTLKEYLTAHRPPALLVTDSGGRSRWLYDAALDGDTLRALRSREMRDYRVALPVTQIATVAAPRFSLARTLGLVVGVGALLGAAASLAPDPVY